MEQIKPHHHNDTDSPKLYAGDSLMFAPQEELTAKNTDSPGATYTSVEQDIIANLQARLNELETKFQTLGFLK